MVFSLTELNLDLCPPGLRQSFQLPDSLAQFPMLVVGNSNDDVSKVKDFINGLENELKKIHAFQRELPFSFTLLNHVIGKLKEKTENWEERRGQDGNFGVGLGNDVVEMKDWMSSAQLWGMRSEEDKCKQKVEGEAVSLFKEDDTAPELSLVTPPVVGLDRGVIRPVFSTVHTLRSLARQTCHAAGRKQRRCWSGELHQHFVDALEKLGGPQVSTPKQIRDLMQVQGLTNDEVKNHLQKYRLHLRKKPASNTKTPSSVEQGMADDKLELGYSNSEVEHSRSPESPLDFAVSKNCNSYSMEDDYEEKSGSHSP